MCDPFIERLLCSAVQGVSTLKPTQDGIGQTLPKTEIETLREELDRLNVEVMVLRDAYAALLKDRDRILRDWILRYNSI